jgi:two-component system, OmpR family, sensor histidine kinase KdpD
MEEDSRPNPDELLENIKKQEEIGKKGKLKLYLGMCAGVGKTFSMLQDASKATGKGIDTVIGYVETHKRHDTEFLLFHLEQIPRKQINYKGIAVEEMDLDAILARKPKLVVVDELAHTNAPGSRHTKRYLDVLEILNNGIDVYTALNVQHLESRTDFVSNITGIIIKETVPDTILDMAYEIELVDISPDELLQRLTDGKVYTKDKSEKAIKNFFRKGNLTALREMSLRITAERVDRQLRDYMVENRISGPWKSGQRILIAISSSPSSAALIRWARKVSYTMEASLVALNVETSKPLSAEDSKNLNSNIDLAKELGAEYISTADEDVVKAIIRTARRENVTDIIIGKSKRKGLAKFFTKDIVLKLLDASGNIDIYIVAEESADNRKLKYILPKPQSDYIKYVWSFLSIALTSALLYPIVPFIGYQSVALILLLVISLLPLFFGPGPVLLASFLSPVIWDYFFVPPQFTLIISKTEDALVFVLFYIVAIVSSILTTKIRSKEILLRKREENATALYQLTKDLSNSADLDAVVVAFKKNINKVFSADAIVMLSDDNGKLRTTSVSEKDYGVAQWVYLNKKKAGKYTDTIPEADMIFVPVQGPRGMYGVAGIKFTTKNLSNEVESFLNIFVNQFAAAIEREILSNTANNSVLFAESEKLYKNLFDSISHELKTPIAAIMGSTSLMLDKNTILSDENKLKLVKEINIAGERLNKLVENLLDMARLESGRLAPNYGWYELNDLYNISIQKLESEIGSRKLLKDIPDNMPLIYIDIGLLEQVIKNILLNCIKYTPADSEIHLNADWDKEFIYIFIKDSGEGIADEHINFIFDKFYRANKSQTGGSGLGLSIAKGFVEAHDGTITAKNLVDGGVMFEIRIPNKSTA